MGQDENLIKFSCPFCGQRLEAPTDMQGESIKCPVEDCKGIIQIPVSKPETVSQLPPPLPSPAPSTKRTIRSNLDDKSVTGIVCSTYSSGRLNDVLGILEKYPWNFESIEFLVNRDPCFTAKLASTIISCRGQRPAPMISGQRLVWNSFAHPLDNAMLVELSRAQIITQAIAKQQALWMDASYKREMLLNAVRVNANHMPKLWALHCDAARRVGLQNPPDLFIKNDRERNAFAGGAVDCFICLNTGLLNALTNEELLFILGHEMGHIIHRHVLFSQIATQLADDAFSSADRAEAVGDGLSLLGGAVGFLGSIVANISSAARTQQGKEIIEKVLRWDQFAELSADRVGLVTCRSVNDAVNALIKIDLEPEFGFASRFGDTFSLPAFLNQYDQAAREYSFVAGDKDYKRSHPYTAYRIRALQAWQLSYGYFRLVTSLKNPS